MPDVGVLNLQIRDDSNEAAGGLDNLVSKLKSLSKIASTKNEGLGNVAQHIRDIVEAVKFDNSKVGTSLKNISTFMNSLAGLTKLNSINKLNVKPIEQLKTAIGEGFNIGQAGTQLNKLREAISGEWNSGNATIARDSMKAVATGAQSLGKIKAASVISSVADALKEYNSALSAQKAVDAGTMEALGRYSTGRIPLNLQQFGGRGSKSSAGQMRMDLDSLMQWSEGFTAIQSTVESAKEPVASLSEAMNDVSSAAQSTQLNEYLVDPITQLMERFRNCEAAAGTFGNSLSSSSYSTNLMSAEAITAARDIELLTDRLNTPIKYKGFGDVVEQLNGIGRGFLSAKEAAEVFEKTPMQDMRIELQETGDVLQSAVINRFQEMYGMFGEMAHNFGWFKKETLRLMEGPDIHRPVAAENMLSTYVEGWKPDWVVADQQIFDDYIAKINEMRDAWIEYGPVAEENMLSTHVENLKPDWVISEQPITESVSDDINTAKQEMAGFTDEYRAWCEEVRHAQEERFYADSGPKDVVYTTQIAESLTQLDLLEAKLREAQDAYNHLFNTEGPGSSKTIKKGLEVQEAEKKIERFVASMESAQAKLSNVDFSQGMSLADTNELAQQVTELDLYKAKLEDAQIAHNQLVNELGAGDARTMQAAMTVQKLSRTVEELETASASGQSAFSQLLGSMEETIFGAHRLRDAFKNMFPTLSGMLSRFKNIAKYRFLRTVLKQITSGAREGLENVYRYSQMVGTSFAPAMDSAASALAQMRNSVGAALAPALQAIIPLLNSIVGAFINVINVANQFFAILGGHSSWTRALPQATQAFDDMKKSAKGAGGAAKDLLADWDELNIIQSSGGGGGGSSGSEILDYENMFEQVAEFDERIKGVVDTIQNGFGGVLELAKKIGAAVIAWKVSKAFDKLVSKLASGLAGVVLLDIGLTFSYGGGYSAGTKGFFDSVDLIQVIGGAIASALGGSLITSGLGIGAGAGFGVGLTLAAVVALTGYIVAQQDMTDKAKWGNLSWTADEIRKFVQGQFSFDVAANIEVLHANVTKLENARKEATAKIGKFKSSLRNTTIQLNLGMDASADGANVAGAVTDAQEAINAVKTRIAETESAIEVSMKVLPFRDGEGNDVSEDILKNIKIADTTLLEYMTDLGNKLADAMYEGEKASWKNGTTEAALELMRAQEEIYNEAERLKKQREFETSLQSSFSKIDVKDGIIDRDTALQVFEEQKKVLEDYKTAAMEAAKAEADELNWLGDLAQAAANHELKTGDKDGKYASLQEAADNLHAAAELRLTELEEQTEQQLAEARETMKTMWTDLFGEVYGEDFEEGLLTCLASNGRDNEFDKSVLDWIGDVFGLNYGDINHKIGKLITKGYSPSEIAKEIKEDLKIGSDGSILYNPNNSFIPDEVNDILKFFGIDAFDVYGEKAKQEIMNALIDAVGGADARDADKRFAAEIFKNLFKAETWDEIDQYMPDGEVPEIEVHWAVKPVVEAEPIDDGDFDIWDVNDLIPNPYGEYTSEAPVAEVEVQAAMTFTTDDLAQSLYDAYSSDGLSVDEIEDIIGQYDIPIGDIIKFVGHSNFFDDDVMRSEIIDMLEKSGSANADPNFVAKKFIRSGQIIGSAGFSDVGYNGYNSNAETGVTREENKQDIAGGVAAGTADLASTLSAILQVAQAINRKNFNFTIAPTAAVGRGVTAGLGALAKVTGND